MELELNPELIYLASVVRKALETVPHDANAQATAEYIAAVLIADGWTNPQPAEAI
jgi:hypothetical protein